MKNNKKKSILLHYSDELTLFKETYYTGKEYDSCVNSPCYWASGIGCKHPEHPLNKEYDALVCPMDPEDEELERP